MATILDSDSLGCASHTLAVNYKSSATLELHIPKDNSPLTLKKMMARFRRNRKQVVATYIPAEKAYEKAHKRI